MACGSVSKRSSGGDRDRSKKTSTEGVLAATATDLEELAAAAAEAGSRKKKKKRQKKEEDEEAADGWLSAPTA